MLNLVNELVAIGEGYQIEFKVSLDKSIAREACAFANASGGKIIIGVTDAGQLKPLNPDNINRLISQAQDILGKLDPKINIKISHGDRFILIDVPEGQRKPYACPDGFFLRIGSNSQKLTRDEIIEMSQWSGAIKFDALEHKTARFDRDFDENAYNQFLQKAQITTSFPPKELLKNLQCMTDDVHFTNVGVLFFTKSVEFLLRQAVCTCVLYKGIDKVKILDRKDYKANIIDNIENAVSFVNRHTNLEYVIEHVRRENIPEIPEIALRESIVNAFCHKYYFEEGSNIIVEVFDDRVVITNFGGLPSGVVASKFGIENISIQRNPVIADLLLRANYIEKVGTGIQRIKQSVAALGKGNVEFDFDNYWFFAKFTRNQAITTSISTLSDQEAITKRQQMILDLFNETNVLTSDQIHTLLNDVISIRIIRRELLKLNKLGYVSFSGNTKSREWFLSKSV